MPTKRVSLFAGLWMPHLLTKVTMLASVILSSFPVSGDEPHADIITKWADSGFRHSTLSRQQRIEELNWIHEAAKPYRGMSIRVVSENIATHRYESEVLARAFREITGIQVVHEVTEEDDLVKKMQVQMDTGIHLYDSYVNDADFIGTHYRYNKTRSLSALMNSSWKPITLPDIDISDFIGIEFVKGLDGEIYQLPTQQFANLYWYRHDWFNRKDIQELFYKTYGYRLSIPQNWAAYEDIAEFFTHTVKEIDGNRVWGHMDYGRYDPSLGWRISDSWLSLAGVNDNVASYEYYHGPGFVGDWGIRVENCHPVGSSVARGGALNSPAAIYAVQKYIDWLNRYAPPEAANLNFSSSSDYLAQGNIAQQIFWYTAFVPTVITDNLTDETGLPVWRLAPSPRGKYWQPGMKSGYQDISGWTFLKSTPEKQAEAAWLYAQFVTSKTVSMSKFLAGFTPIRLSDLQSSYLESRSAEWGGLLEFYLSEARNSWTPTGSSVPDYAYLSSAWWQYIGAALREEMTVEESMSALAVEIDRRLGKIQQEGEMKCAPVLKEEKSEQFVLDQAGSPWLEFNAPVQPMTLPYEETLLLWQSY